MGSVSTSRLAVAVADAGGVGSITALGMTARDLNETLAAMATRTAGVLAANFLTEQIDRDAVVAAASRVRIVDFFWANPDPSIVDLVHAGGALACWQVGSLDEALAAADAGCDIVVAQGIEAGGHVRGQTPLRPLLGVGACQAGDPRPGSRGHRRRARIPIGAGGRGGGGPEGTRFVAAVESGAHPAYKQALVEAGIDATEITAAFSVCPLCATVPRARVLRSCIDALRDLPDQDVGATTIGGQHIPVGRAWPSPWFKGDRSCRGDGDVRRRVRGGNRQRPTGSRDHAIVVRCVGVSLS